MNHYYHRHCLLLELYAEVAGPIFIYVSKSFATDGVYLRRVPHATTRTDCSSLARIYISVRAISTRVSMSMPLRPVASMASLYDEDLGTLHVDATYSDDYYSMEEG